MGRTELTGIRKNIPQKPVYLRECIKFRHHRGKEISANHIFRNLYILVEKKNRIFVQNKIGNFQPNCPLAYDLMFRFSNDLKY